ncbi:argininosuccinate lyase [Sporomusa sphaeroides]|uniref:Argininosuccinate lyase n=1 Tax=Sporomusa sphaeroides DSM 2875 TaxID=1337886 RepID=A0ABM9W1R8_9FIRM|nr:argininosuccinate lyase [Sporomusa sphaeroides]OLS56984.1 argininosuccinate lyase 1 [Sporomusa sphaeroides DSM 2875]CVK18170.1 Argininosuccinate lyase 1 [Sporomusa sphaeroides DSM 2875]
MSKLWGGRFAKSTDVMVEEFTSSISFDNRMYRQDIAGSIAHARMLAKCGIISQEDAKLIIDGLQGILADIEAGNFSFEVSLEDIHMNIEKRLTERIGPAGGRLHTARSRNDQVALDTHMYVREQVAEIAGLLFELEQAVLDTAEKYPDVIMPGYTHLQRAQPILFSHHMMAYFFMFERDFRRLKGVWESADIMPLGAGALAGTTFPIDREAVARELKFGRIYENSLDAVSDRDYILEFLSFASILMMHLSRISEEIILWSSTEFSFIELDDAHCTGSSIMPQKKNPDVAELVRGKTGRVFGHLMAMLTVAKGLPLAYNKDLQEDKEGLFDTIDTVKFSLTVYAAMLRGMKVNVSAMRQALRTDFSNATDMADYLVKKGLPFRQAHEVVGKCVAYCLSEQKTLTDLTLKEFEQFSPLFAADIIDAISVETCVAARNSMGGTSPTQVGHAVTIAKSILEKQQKHLDMYTKITL